MGKFTDKLKGTKDKFTALKKKFPKGSIFGKKPEVKPGEEGLAASGAFFHRAAAEGHGTKYGEERKKSILNPFRKAKAKGKKKYHDWKAKREEEKKKKPKVKKWCPLCEIEYTGDKCPKCGKSYMEAKRAASGGEAPEKEKKKRFKLRKGAPGVFAASIAGLGFSIFFEMPYLTIIVFGIFIGLAIVAFFLPPPVKWLLIAGFIGSLFFLYQTGQFEEVTSHPKIIPYVEAIDETWEKAKEEATKLGGTINCYRKINPDEVEKCLKELEEKEKTEISNPYKLYKTLEFKWGLEVNDYELNPVEQDYILETELINNNEKVYEINITDMQASTDEKTGTRLREFSPENPYIIYPKDEPLPVIFEFSGIEECTGSKTFKVNVTTRQESGGTSEFGIAPSEEDDLRNFVRRFKPKIIAEPGPLNIYAYTYPFAIDASRQKDFKIYIKIQNPKVDGTAEIDKFYLIQDFEVPEAPDKLFDINDTSCRIVSGVLQYSEEYPNCKCQPEGIDYKCKNCGASTDESCCVLIGTGGECIRGDVTLCFPDETTDGIKIYGLRTQSANGKCSGSGTNHNCLEFTFIDSDGIISPYILKPNKKLTISCKAIEVKKLDSEYTDQIRVFANFKYVQEWSKSIPCAT